MGFSSSVEDIHEKFCHEFSLSKEEINLIETYYCPNFETDDYGFTIAQEFIDRSLNLEKITILYRKNLVHECSLVNMIVTVVLWEQIEKDVANNLFILKCTRNKRMIRNKPQLQK